MLLLRLAFALLTGPAQSRWRGVSDYSMIVHDITHGSARTGGPDVLEHRLVNHVALAGGLGSLGSNQA